LAALSSQNQCFRSGYHASSAANDDVNDHSAGKFYRLLKCAEHSTAVPNVSEGHCGAGMRIQSACPFRKNTAKNPLNAFALPESRFV
jgi:hypothetical protein